MLGTHVTRLGLLNRRPLPSASTFETQRTLSRSISAEQNPSTFKRGLSRLRQLRRLHIGIYESTNSDGSYTQRKFRRISSIEGQETTNTRGNRFCRLYGLVGPASAAILYQEEDQPEEKPQFSLPADPWILTNTTPKTESEVPETTFAQLLSIIWRAIKLLTGLDVLIRLARTCVSAIIRAKNVMSHKIVTILNTAFREQFPITKPVDAYAIAQELSIILSQLSTTGITGAGEFDALSRDFVASLASSKAASILTNTGSKSRADSQLNWFQPYVSGSSYEEILLAPQYISFLARARMDGAIYHLEGYFGANGDLKAIPMDFHYTRVASSIHDLRQGNITEKWTKQLSGRWNIIGSNADSEHDYSTEFRAIFLRSDLSRLVSDDDWIQYIGVPISEASMERIRSSVPGQDTWAIASEPSESTSKTNLNGDFAPNSAQDTKTATGKRVKVQIETAPLSPIARMEVTFPESGDLLENVTPVEPVIGQCARWCIYAEKQPIIQKIVGKNVKLVSAPTMQVFSVDELADFTGTVADFSFMVAGSRGAATIHVRTARDANQDGRSPVLPAVGVWVETSSGKVQVYKNARQRFTNIITKAITAPTQISMNQAAYLATDFVPVR